MNAPTLPLGSVTAPYPEDSAHGGGGEGAAAPAPILPWPRLALLGNFQREASSLLLQSFYGMHRDVLDFTQISDDYSLGIRVAVGDFVHRPSGIRYIVSIAAVEDAQPQPAETTPAERIGECEVCGNVDHHLVHGACQHCNERARRHQAEDVS